MIEVQDLVKLYRAPIKTRNPIKNIFFRKYAQEKALRGISFQVKSDEIVGLVGPNGAGKTTLMKILSGILYPTSGQVRVSGHIPFEKKHTYLQNIGFVMGQKNQLFWELPAVDTFRLNKEIYEISDTDYKKVSTELIDLLDAQELLYRPVKTLSLGQRMRMEFIAALIHTPSVLFLDEPMIGLDMFAQSQIISFIKEYQRRSKATILVTSHNMQDIQKMAQRMIVLDKGSIVYDGSVRHMVSSYSQQKTITVTLSKKIALKKLQLPKEAVIEYQYPLLAISVTKPYIEKTLHSIMKAVEYDDLTIEDESLEEILKRRLRKA